MVAPQVIDRVGKLFGMLGSSHDGEVISAVRRMADLLKRNGHSFHSFYQIIGGGSTTGTESVVRLEMDLTAARQKIQTLEHQLVVCRRQLTTTEGQLEGFRQALFDASRRHEEMQRQIAFLTEKTRRYDAVAAIVSGVEVKGSSTERAEMFEQLIWQKFGRYRGAKAQAARTLNISYARLQHYLRGRVKVPPSLLEQIRAMPDRK